VPGKQGAPFKIGPSAIARYFFHDCERFLRFNSTRRDLAASQGIPQRPFDTSPIMQAILDQGFHWELAVLGKLGKRVHIPAGSGPVTDRKFTWEETLGLLRTAGAGQYIYQPTLRAPNSLYDHFGLNRSLVEVADNHPDLVEICGDGNSRRFRVIDIKRGASMRATYRIQVLLYAIELELILRDHKIDDAHADLKAGYAWLGDQDEPTECDLESIRPLLDGFLREDLPRILSAPAEKTGWHVNFRCEWCPYFEHCRQEMRDGDNISRLTGLTVHGKRYLVREGRVTTLSQLDRLLRRKDADAILSRSASLVGKRLRLRDQVDAFKGGGVVVGRGSTPMLPVAENVGIYLMLQQEPLGKKVYLAGVLVHVAKKVRAQLGETIKADPYVWLADRDTPDAIGSVRRGVIDTLYGTLRHIHEYNADKDWSEKLSVQTYVYSEHERSILVRCLLEGLEEPELSLKAMSLLFYFQGPDLLLTDDHPDVPVQYPLVVLLSVIGRLLALPVDVSYTLPETLAALGCTFTYPRRDFYHFPLGHGLRPDAIYLAWTQGRAEFIERLYSFASGHLYAIRSVTWDVRTRAKGNLFAWPPKFALPGTADIRNPLLSKLAFFCRFESLLGCMAVRDVRSEAQEVQVLLGNVVELIFQSDGGFGVVGDVAATFDEGFPRYLIVRDSPAGRRGQLEFQDYYYRDRWGAKPHPDRSVATVLRVKCDRLNFPRSIKFKCSFDPPPQDGERFLLYERFTDFNTEKVVNHLQYVDRVGHGLFLDVVHNPLAASRVLPLPVDCEQFASREEERLELTGSQLEAYRAIRKRSLVAVWGPPGTGKTHFLASVILGLASAHAQAGEPFHVLVTAFTHASIENVLRKIHQLHRRWSALSTKDLAIAKSGGWRSLGAAPGEDVEPNDLTAWLSENPFAVVGATVWASLKVDDQVQKFDLVIVDEASQVRVPESSIPMSLVAPKGRLLVAGDHMQLPPIVAGQYPEPAEKEPVLHRSIFELIKERSEGGGANGPFRQLLENWRMNDVLTSFAAALIYGDKYRCATNEVAGRRLRLLAGTSESPVIAACVDPAHPLVIAVIEGAPAAKENQIEAALVADLVLTLRSRMLDHGRNAYANDAAFFQHGMFVVSPHHVQIRLIRNELAAKRSWDHPPFVDTVDKMQGQEAEVVVVSYGVSDAEYAMREATFIYGLNRINVAVTRAKSKCVVFLPAPLLKAMPDVLDIPEAELGYAYMRKLVAGVQADGETLVFKLAKGVQVTVMRTSSPQRSH
jgi:DNA replication ATP-dependent helicase Dna2